MPCRNFVITVPFIIHKLPDGLIDLIFKSGRGSVTIVRERSENFSKGHIFYPKRRKFTAAGPVTLYDEAALHVLCVG